MAKANLEIPRYMIEKMERLEQDTRKMMEEMVEAGANVTYKNMLAKLPEGIKNSEMVNNLRVTRVYDTPSDEGINAKVAFYGYFTNEDGKITPAPLVANVFEYGRSDSPFPKEPFMRRSFNNNLITKAMLAIEEKYIPKE